MCVNAFDYQVCSGDVTFHTICSVRLPHAEDFGGILLLLVYVLCPISAMYKAFRRTHFVYISCQK